MFFDTHAHLFDDRFATDLTDVIARAPGPVLTVGIDLASSLTSVQQAIDYSTLRAAVGIQPNSVAEAQPTDWDDIVALIQGHLLEVAALGETGLDRHWHTTPFPMQEDYFARHLALARELNKPVVIHCREAEADVVRMLQDDFEKHGPVKGVMHSYTGDAATMDACLAMGLYISFAGMITYKTGTELKALSAKVPDDRLLIETDCPYLAPVPMRGRRNEPAYVVHTAAAVAESRGRSLETVSAITTANARKLFAF